MTKSPTYNRYRNGYTKKAQRAALLRRPGKVGKYVENPSARRIKRRQRRTLGEAAQVIAPSDRGLCLVLDSCSMARMLVRESRYVSSDVNIINIHYNSNQEARAKKMGVRYHGGQHMSTLVESGEFDGERPVSVIAADMMGNYESVHELTKVLYHLKEHARFTDTLIIMTTFQTTIRNGNGSCGNAIWNAQLDMFEELFPSKTINVDYAKETHHKYSTTHGHTMENMTWVLTEDK